MIAALKHAVAHFGRSDSFRVTRPPLLALDQGASAALVARLENARFEMPGLAVTLAG